MNHKTKPLYYNGRSIHIDLEIYDLLKTFHKYGGQSAQSCQGGEFTDKIEYGYLPLYFENNQWRSYAWIIIEKMDFNLLQIVFEENKINYYQLIYGSNGHYVKEYGTDLIHPLTVMFNCE